MPPPPDPEEPTIVLPAPAILDGVPTWRLRSKTAVPVIRSMMNMEGEKEWGSQVLIQVPLKFQMVWLAVVCDVPTTVLKFLNTSQSILTWMMQMAAMSPARLWALTRNKRQQALRQKLQQSSIWR